MRNISERIFEFYGLSDRYTPAQLGLGESPDLLNVDRSRRSMKKRGGWEAVHDQPLRDSSIRLSGVEEYGRIPSTTNYDHGTTAATDDRFCISIDLELIRKGIYDSGTPTAGDRTVFCKGYGTGANLSYRLYYDVSLNGGLGGWTADVRYGGATTTLSVNDGDAGEGGIPVGAYRHIELGTFNGTWELRVYDEDSLIGSAVGGTGQLNNTTAPTPRGRTSSTHGWPSCGSQSSATLPTRTRPSPSQAPLLRSTSESCTPSSGSAVPS